MSGCGIESQHIPAAAPSGQHWVGNAMAVAVALRRSGFYAIYVRVDMGARKLSIWLVAGAIAWAGAVLSGSVAMAADPAPLDDAGCLACHDGKKGELTIPATIRRASGIGQGSKAALPLENAKVELQ